MSNSPPCTIAPWLSVRKSAQAVDFYESAFGATEVFRLDGPDESVVARLSVEGAEFWASDESPEHHLTASKGEREAAAYPLLAHRRIEDRTDEGQRGIV
jgi:uncharacterized glyoxalase superfamily protein PhnB